MDQQKSAKGGPASGWHASDKTQTKRTEENLVPKEVESINGYYKKIVLEKTDQKPYELTDLGKKVFNDRYSLKDKNGEQMEHAPEQMWSVSQKQFLK